MTEMALCKASGKLYSVKQIKLSFMKGALMKSINVRCAALHEFFFCLNVLFVARKSINLLHG